MRASVIATILATVLLADIAAAQTATYAACRDAGPDSFAVDTTSNLFALPGVATDFILDAGGQFVDRGDGTARFSGYLRRRSETDRRFLLEVELSGEVLPGAPNHPPLGSLANGLSAAAYAPAGPVDPTAFRYFTVGAGSLRGFGAYAGALASLQLSAPLQLGVGANNRNAQTGLAANFSVTMLSQPTYILLQPNDEAQLRATTQGSQTQCASHVDRDDGLSAGAVRRALSVPGVGLDYVFIPAGEWIERQDGTAELRGTMRREDDFDDRWELLLVLQNRTDPGDGAYPPADGAVLGLLPTAYVAGGGIVDPDSFRFYSAAAGTLTGAGNNAGGSITLSAARSFQVGIGADQGNSYFGVYGEMVATVATQPTSHAIAVTGNATVAANVSTLCILPYPNQTPGLHWVLDNVSDQFGIMTGANLAWIEQMTIGTRTITSNQRNWTGGYLKVVSSSQVEVHQPQGMVPGTYTTRVFTRSMAGGFRQMTLNVPAAPAAATAPDRFVGEPQDWLVSHGNFGPTLIVLAASSQQVPSVAPGIVSLGIGAAFSELFVLATLFTEPVTGSATFHAPAIPATVRGVRLYYQAAALNPLAPLPAQATNITTTLYQ